MSILSALRARKITWQQAATEIEQWGAGLIGKSPAAVHDAITATVADVKQVASDAISMGDTLAGPLIDEAADVAGTAFTSAASRYLGPFGGLVTPAALDAIDKIRDGVKAELDTLALELKSQLAASAPAPALAQPSPQ